QHSRRARVGEPELLRSTRERRKHRWKSTRCSHRIGDAHCRCGYRRQHTVIGDADYAATLEKPCFSTHHVGRHDMKGWPALRRETVEQCAVVERVVMPAQLPRAIEEGIKPPQQQPSAQDASTQVALCEIDELSRARPECVFLARGVAFPVQYQMRCEDRPARYRENVFD